MFFQSKRKLMFQLYFWADVIRGGNSLTMAAAMHDALGIFPSLIVDKGVFRISDRSSEMFVRFAL